MGGGGLGFESLYYEASEKVKLYILLLREYLDQTSKRLYKSRKKRKGDMN